MLLKCGLSYQKTVKSTLKHSYLCIQDTLSSRAALGLPAECVARAKVSCIQLISQFMFFRKCTSLKSLLEFSIFFDGDFGSGSET